MSAMPYPFTRRQTFENEAFLDGLRRTGNARLAARTIGRAHSTMHNRRAAHAEFAQAWDAAAASAHAAFHLAGGNRGPEEDAGSRSCRAKAGRAGTGSSHTPLDFARDERGLRTRGGEPMVVRTRSGRLQLRLAHPGKLTKQAEQVFLLALSATANIRLSAAAAGASPAAFNRRRRENPAFAREFRLALKMGYDRLEAEALRAAMPESHAYDAWRSQEPPALPPLSVAQMLQLLYLHQRGVRESWDAPHHRKRRDEPWETYAERLRAMAAADRRREAEDAALRRAFHYEESGDWRYEDERPPLPLPPLALVTGWSRAGGKPPHRPGGGLFGGWGMEEMRSSRQSGTSAGKKVGKR
jgi:hypothetical protein